MSKKNNNHRKEKKNNPDSGNGPFGAPVEQDGNNEHNNENAKSKEVPTFEVGERAVLSAHTRNLMVSPPSGQRRQPSTGITRRCN